MGYSGPRIRPNRSSPGSMTSCTWRATRPATGISPSSAFLHGPKTVTKANPITRKRVIGAASAKAPARIASPGPRPGASSRPTIRTKASRSFTASAEWSRAGTCSSACLRGPGYMLLGFLKVLRDDLPCDPGGPTNGIGYTVLAWSHDGENWQRDREPFFDRDHQAGGWDHAMAWMDYQLPVGDEVYMYYGGYARGHKVERFTERQIGLVRTKRDRYGAPAADGGGLLRTRLVALEGNKLALNVDASGGAARVQILDDKEKPILGFRFEDCDPIRGDALSASVRWKRTLSGLGRQPVRLEFALRSAKLFGFEISK